VPGIASDKSQVGKMNIQGKAIFSTPAESRSFYIVFSSVLVLVVLTFSIQWLYPIYVQHISGGDYSFVPLRRAYYGYDNDKYFYYSHIRNIINGNFPSLDPASFEHKHQYNIHTTYSFSLLMCSLGGLLTKNIRHAYYFNYLVYPAINLLIIYLLLKNITAEKYWSLFFALLIIFEPPHLFHNFRKVVQWLLSDNRLQLFDFANNADIFRTPNTLFTGLPILFLVYFLFRAVELHKKSWLDYSAIAFIVITSPLTSIPNFLVSLTIVFSIACAYTYKNVDKIFLCVLAGSVLSTLPFAFFIWKAQQLLNSDVEMLKMLTPPYPYFNQFSSKIFFPDFIYMILPVGLFSFMKFSMKRFLLSLSYGIILSYLLLTLTKGSYAAYEYFQRGSSKSIFTLCMMSSFILSISHISSSIPSKNTIRAFINQMIRKKSINTRLTILIFIVAASAFLFQYAIIRNNYTNYNDKDFNELAIWSSKNLSVSDVAVTLDADLITNLIIYSPVNMYLPPAVLSPISYNERFTRFMEIAKAYGMSFKEFRNLLDGILPLEYLYRQSNPTSDFVPIRLALLDLVLFYAKHHENTPYPFSTAEKDALVKRYKELLPNNKIFTYKANVLIISRFDDNYIKLNSNVSHVIHSQKPVFANNTYKIYYLN
jgi:hypothetical protein